MNGRSRLGFVLVLVVLLAVAMLPGARAQEGDTPAEGAGVTAMADSINFQGRLLTSGGGAVTPGTYLMKFSLCSDSSCGTVIWESGEYTVTVDGSGLFSVLLAPLRATYFGGNPYLKTEVCTTSGTTCSVWDTELAPQPISSVALAVGNIRKNVADSSSASSTGYVLDVSNTGTGGALHGSTSGPDGAGVKGENANPDGSGSGVWGVHAHGGAGVAGSGRYGVAGDGTQYGVVGTGGTAGVIGSSSADGVQGTGGQHGVSGDGTVGVYGTTTAAANGIGVHGTTGGYPGTGVKGENTNVYGNGYGVWGAHALGTGVLGTGRIAIDGVGTAYGVLGSGGTAGVRGSSGADGVQGTGGQHGVSGDGPVGVYGTTTAAANGIGVHGTTGGNAGTGVKGENTNVSGDGFGVWGAHALGTGVLGTGRIAIDGVGTAYGVLGSGNVAVLATGTEYGVRGTGNVAVLAEGTEYGVHGTGSTGVKGESAGDTGTGVYGVATSWATTSYGIGVDGEARGSSSTHAAIGVQGRATSMVPDAIAVGVFAESVNARGIGLWASNTSATGSVIAASSLGGDVFRGYQGNPYYGGTMIFRLDYDGVGKSVGGWVKQTPVSAPDGQGTELRTLHTMQNAEAWSEDLGTGTLVNGEGRVEIDSLWAQVVNLETGYRVFFTPLGDCAGLYVVEKAPGYFIVRELQGGTSNIEFDYRIIAHPRGYETGRMEVIAPDTPVVGEAAAETVP